jgi:hypothetical protein
MFNHLANTIGDASLGAVCTLAGEGRGAFPWCASAAPTMEAIYNSNHPTSATNNLGWSPFDYGLNLQQPASHAYPSLPFPRTHYGQPVDRVVSRPAYIYRSNGGASSYNGGGASGYNNGCGSCKGDEQSSAWSGRMLQTDPAPSETCPDASVTLSAEFPFKRTYRYLPTYDTEQVFPLDSYSVIFASQRSQYGPNKDVVIPMGVVDRIMFDEITERYADSLLVERALLQGQGWSGQALHSRVQQLARENNLRVVLVDYSPTVELLAQEIRKILLPRTQANGVKLIDVSVRAEQGFSNTRAYTGSIRCY